MRGMDSILHHTTKYDGSLHYRFPARIVARSEEVIVIYRGPGVEFTSYRGTKISETHILVFFYRSRYHNVAIAWKGDWTPHMHYVNVASPATWDNTTVSAVDLDLDVIRFARNGQIVIDDEDEFEQHIEHFGYPGDLVDTCRTEVKKIHRAMGLRRGILSDRVFDWRPGAALAEELLAPL